MHKSQTYSIVFKRLCRTYVDTVPATDTTQIVHRYPFTRIGSDINGEWTGAIALAALYAVGFVSHDLLASEPADPAQQSAERAVVAVEPPNECNPEEHGHQKLEYEVLEGFNLGEQGIASLEG